MVIVKKTRIVFLLAILSSLFVAAALKFSDMPGTSLILSPIGEVELRTSLPKSPAEMPLYKVVGDESIEGIKTTPPEYGEVRYNLPPEEEAIRFALEALKQYGGVPEDAKLSRVQTEYVEVVNTSTGKIIDRKPTLVRVSFQRYLNGMPVIGPGGEITVFIGDNGEIIDLIKIWRKLEYVGNVRIIPAEKAYEKLKKGEVMRKPMGMLKLRIVHVEPGYYAGGFGDEQEYYIPVWVFHCKDHLGNNVTLAVKALV